MTAAPVTVRGRPTATIVRRRLRTGTLFALMCLIAVIMLYPFFYMLDNAFRNQAQFERQSFPGSPLLPRFHQPNHLRIKINLHCSASKEVRPQESVHGPSTRTA